MSEAGDYFREWRDRKRQARQSEMPCPRCSWERPSREPPRLIPGQSCWCGYTDERAAKAVSKRK